MVPNITDYNSRSQFIKTVRVLTALPDQVKTEDNVDIYSYKGINAYFESADDIQFLVNLINLSIKASEENKDAHILCLIKHPTKNSFVYQVVPSISITKVQISQKAKVDPFTAAVMNNILNDSVKAV